MPRSLVTGGAGFIGSGLVFELQSRGHDVVVVDSMHSGSAENLRGFQGELVQEDVSEKLSVTGRFDYIFHQAALTDPRYPNDGELYTKNVDGFHNVIARADSDGAKLIYASSAGLYGNGAIPMKEEQPKDILTVYGKSKLHMDDLARGLSAKMQVVGLRYFNVFGPREASKGRPASMVYHLWTQMREGKRPRLFKFGEQKRDFIYVKDVVTANLCAMEGNSGVYNVGTGIGSSFNDLVDALNSAMGTALQADYFDMPYDPKTYQSDTLAYTDKAFEGIGFKAEWDFKSAVSDYVKWLEKAS